MVLYRATDRRTAVKNVDVFAAALGGPCRAACPKPHRARTGRRPCTLPAGTVSGRGGSPAWRCTVRLVLNGATINKNCIQLGTVPNVTPMTTIYRTELRNSSAGATSPTACRVAEMHCTLEADLTGQHCDVMSTAESLVRRLR